MSRWTAACTITVTCLKLSYTVPFTWNIDRESISRVVEACYVQIDVRQVIGERVAEIAHDCESHQDCEHNWHCASSVVFQHGSITWMEIKFTLGILVVCWMCDKSILGSLGLYTASLSCVWLKECHGLIHRFGCLD